MTELDVVAEIEVETEDFSDELSDEALDQRPVFICIGMSLHR